MDSDSAHRLTNNIFAKRALTKMSSVIEVQQSIEVMQQRASLSPFACFRPTRLSHSIFITNYLRDLNAHQLEPIV